MEQHSDECRYVTGRDGFGALNTKLDVERCARCAWRATHERWPLAKKVVRA